MLPGLAAHGPSGVSLRRAGSGRWPAWLRLALVAAGLLAAGCGRAGAPVVKATATLPTSPARASARTGSFEYMPLPIYPDARKAADSRTRSRSRQGKATEHQIIVIVTSARPTLVKAWYVDRMKASVLMDQPSTDRKSRTVTLTQAPAGRSEDLPPDTVVIQSDRSGGTQITLSAYRYLPGG